VVGHSRRVACLLLAVTCAATAPLLAQEAPQPALHAVVIGVSKFAKLPEQEWLEFAHADAQDFAKFIASQRGRSFPSENIYLLTNDGASYYAIRSKLGNTLARKIKPEDTVYIFIATHGVVEKEEPRAGYLLAHDSDQEDLYTTAVAMNEIGNIVRDRLQKAKRIFVFADACRAGKLRGLQGDINRYIADASRPRGETMVLLASGPNEFSFEGKQFCGGHGAFTCVLLKGLMGAADRDKDSNITVREIIRYLQTEIETATNGRQNVREIGDADRETRIAFVDKAGPPDLKLAGLPRPEGAEIAALQAQVPESLEVRASFQRALRENRLLAPAGNNAWDLYQRFSQLPMPQSQKEALQDDLVIALATAGDRVLDSYRRGDQVIKLDAARYEEGAQLYARAVQLDPQDATLPPKARFMAGRALVENRRFAEGISVLREAIALDPNAAYSYNALGIAYMEQQQWNEAIESFRAALARAEKWIYPRFNLGYVYIKLQRYREAEQEYKRGIELGTELGRKYAYLHLNLGFLYLQQGRLAEAQQQFRRAIGMRPDDALSYYNLGLIFQSRGNQRDAETNFRKAAELDARLVDARLRLAEIYEKQRRRDLQEKILREAVAGDPRRSDAAEALGRLLVETKKLGDAEQIFMQMLSDENSAALALSWLGDIHAAQRNFAQAAEDYRQALGRTSDARMRRELERKLNSVEKKK